MAANEVVDAKNEARSRLVHSKVFRVAEPEALIPLQFLANGQKKPLNVARRRCRQIRLAENGLAIRSSAGNRRTGDVSHSIRDAHDGFPSSSCFIHGDNFLQCGQQVWRGAN